MTDTLSCPFLDIADSIPDSLYVLRHEPSGKYGCYCHEGVHGLACFSTQGHAFRFAEWIDLSGMASQNVTFDEARDIAKARPLPIVSLMLLDDMSAPKIHYVR